MKEDIANLERYIGNTKVDTHAELPIIMADAYSDSKKKSELADKVLKDKKQEIIKKNNKVLGAEKQPVPKMPEEAKINLEESLFEDYKGKALNEGTDFDMSGLKNAETFDELRDLISGLADDGIINDEQHDDFQEIVDEKESDCEDYLDRLSQTTSIDVKDVYGYQQDYVHDAVKAIMHRGKDNGFSESLTEAMYYDEDSFIPTLKDSMVDLGIAFDEVAELVNSAYFNSDEINNLFATNYPFQRSFDEVSEEVGAWITYFIEGLNNKEYNYEESLKEGRKSDPFVDSQGNTYSDEDRSSPDMNDSYKDIYTIIFNELSPEHSNWMKKTRVKDIPMRKRYDAYDVGTDMDDNIIVHADSEEDFELARRVADAYGLEFREPKRRALDRDLTATIVMPK